MGRTSCKAGGKVVRPGVGEHRRFISTEETPVRECNCFLSILSVFPFHNLRASPLQLAGERSQPMRVRASSSELGPERKRETEQRPEPQAGESKEESSLQNSFHPCLPFQTGISATNSGHWELLGSEMGSVPTSTSPAVCCPGHCCCSPGAVQGTLWSLSLWARLAVTVKAEKGLSIF